MVLNDVQCSAPAAVLEEVLDRGEGNCDGTPSCSTYPLQCFFCLSHCSWIIELIFSMSNTFKQASVKSPKDAGGDRASAGTEVSAGPDL